MCDTCGCNDNKNIIYHKFSEDSDFHEHHYDHTHEHHHEDGTHSHSHHHHVHHEHEGGSVPHTHEHTEHPEDHSHTHYHEVEKNILGKNDLLAERNRGYLEAKNITSFNLVSSPGSGKTSLLEKTIQTLKDEIHFSVIEGDQQTTNDAERIHKTGASVVQINTGTGCHLDAEMINKAVKELAPPEGSVLFIENVGNLVCPALFDLGEKKRIVIISTTEGEDKPLKYPYMFNTSHLCIINKTDLLPYLDFDLSKLKEFALRINPKIEFIELSVKSGEGMEKWYKWLKKQLT
ncbi:MAG: hydrogenase nickel incorporation protein HypB [Sphingobacteriales bacterium]|nr:hydrogenase nickel incorporation protein HypB [Sphingobacteriales bacterium]